MDDFRQNCVDEYSYDLEQTNSINIMDNDIQVFINTLQDENSYLYFPNSEEQMVENKNDLDDFAKAANLKENFINTPKEEQIYINECENPEPKSEVCPNFSINEKSKEENEEKSFNLSIRQNNPIEKNNEKTEKPEKIIEENPIITKPQNNKNSKCGRMGLEELREIYSENGPKEIENIEKMHTCSKQDNVETKAQKNFIEKSRLTIIGLMNKAEIKENHYVAKICPDFTKSVWKNTETKFDETLEEIFTRHGCAGKQLQLKINKEINVFNIVVFRKIKENPIFSEAKKLLAMKFSEFIGLINGKNRENTILKYNLSQDTLELLPTVDQMVEEEKKKKDKRTLKFCDDECLEKSTQEMLHKYRSVLMDFEELLRGKKRKEKKNFRKKSEVVY